MLEKYDEFTNKKKTIDNQQKDLGKKLKGLKKQKLQIELDQFNKQKQEIQKKMNNFVSGSSNYN